MSTLVPKDIHSSQSKNAQGSLSMIVEAANKSFSLDSASIEHGFANVVKQLADRKLSAIDVVRDGNCFFSALSSSIIIYGTQSRHYDFRAFTARHFLENFGFI